VLEQIIQYAETPGIAFHWKSGAPEVVVPLGEVANGAVVDSITKGISLE
jgi:hypothetical protein